mgnify:FL=1
MSESCSPRAERPASVGRLLGQRSAETPVVSRASSSQRPTLRDHSTAARLNGSCDEVNPQPSSPRARRGWTAAAFPSRTARRIWRLVDLPLERARPCEAPSPPLRPRPPPSSSTRLPPSLSPPPRIEFPRTPHPPRSSPAEPASSSPHTPQRQLQANRTPTPTRRARLVLARTSALSPRAPHRPPHASPDQQLPPRASSQPRPRPSPLAVVPAHRTSGTSFPWASCRARRPSPSSRRRRRPSRARCPTLPVLQLPRPPS